MGIFGTKIIGNKIIRNRKKQRKINRTRSIKRTIGWFITEKEKINSRNQNIKRKNWIKKTRIFAKNSDKQQRKTRKTTFLGKF